MDIKKLNNAFRETINYTPSKSLVELCHHPLVLASIGDDSSVAEIGCGHGSLVQYTKFLKANYVGLDISDVAISKAREAYPDLKFINCCASDYDFSGCDLVIDSHFLHFLSNESLREKYFLNLKSKLEKGSLVIGETIVRSKNSCLYPDHLLVREARDLEGEFLKYGFSILYFMCKFGKKLIVDKNRTEALESDPDVLEYILKLV